MVKDKQCKHIFELKEARKTFEYQICQKCGFTRKFYYHD